MEGDVLIAMVEDVDDDDVALPRIDGRAGELAVDGKDGLFTAEPRVVALLYLQPVLCIYAGKTTIQHRFFN